MQSAFRRFLTVFLSFALLLPAVTGLVSHGSATETYTLAVFETSDLHGFLVDSGYEDESLYQYRLAYIADKVDDCRKGDTRNTLLLDGGDIYQGNVVSNLQNGAPIVAAYDAMEYDAVALGNHEFDWGITNTTDTDGTMPKYTFAGTDYDSDIPILCSNIYYAGTSNRVNFTQDYAILNKTATSPSGKTIDVNVAVIGYAENYSSSILSTEIAPYEIWYSLNEVETLASTLKSQGLADAVVLLAHSDASELSAKLSANTKVDLVCGGHSHYGQTGKSSNVSYIQGASQGSAYAYAELRFAQNGDVTVENMKHIWTTDYVSKLHDTPANSTELASDVLQISHMALEGVQAEINASLGYITTAVTSNAIGNNSMSTTGGNWLADMANRATGAQVSFTNQGGIRASFYLSGGRRTITKGDIYTIAPFNNLLYVYDVSYEKLLDILNYAIGYGKGLSMRMSGIDCYYQSGSVTALVLNGECIYKNGRWKDGIQSQTVRISANEFVATASGTPFYALNNTDAFVNSAHVDNESFIRVLEEEGKTSGGLLFVDPNAHLIEGSYAGDVEQNFTIRTSYSGKGSVTPTTKVRAGNDHTVFIQPAEGYRIAQVLVDGVNVGAVEEYTFRNVQKDHRLSVNFVVEQGSADTTCNGGRDCPSAGFTDTPSTENWAHAGIDFAVQNGLFQGTSDTTFSPSVGMTRAMLVTVLWRYEGSPKTGRHSFVDVPDGSWYAQAVAWASKNGIVNGVSTDRFDPDSGVSREQLASILFRYSYQKGFDTISRAYLSSYADTSRVSDWAYGPMQWAVAKELVRGTTQGDLVCLDPQGGATREQVAAILMRFVQNVVQ